jgi:hypothetical protein
MTYSLSGARRFLSLAIVTCLLLNGSFASAQLPRMRALHMEGNWGGNIRGIRTSVSSFLDSAPTIAATSVQSDVVRSSFVNASGKTITNDVARIQLTGVKVGSSASYARAGFLVGRIVDTQEVYLQFRPSIDPSLAAIAGFAGDITLRMSADGTSLDTSQISLASGAALDYAAAVVANAQSLVQGSRFALQAPATFDLSAVTLALDRFRARVLASKDDYFQFLKAEHAEWLGISVAIFSDSLADPTVKVKYRPAGDASETTYTYDDADLRNFIARAKQFGFRIYLTLAFQNPVAVSVSQSDPTCNTAQYRVDRGFFGQTTVQTGDPNQRCINRSYWWWSPSHPDHKRNVAQFWDSYRSLAVKYATLSKQLGVDMYSLGTETDNLFRSRPAMAPYTNDFKPQLTQMVAAVRAVYPGLLTYDQHWLAVSQPQLFGGGAGSAHLFADLGLDVVGISAYFPLVDSPPAGVLSVARFETSWESIFKRYLIPLRAANPKRDIVFTEFGYTDDVGAPAHASSNLRAVEPPRDASASTDGMRQQQNILQAFFNVNARHDDLVRGAFLWGNQVFSGNVQWQCDHISFTLYCRPSAKTISDIYGK